VGPDTIHDTRERVFESKCLPMFLLLLLLLLLLGGGGGGGGGPGHFKNIFVFPE